MSVYVALSCLIAFAIVITICLVKQFIWEPLLSKHFKVLRPFLSETARKLPTSLYHPQSAAASNLSVNQSTLESSFKTIEPWLLQNKNFMTAPQNLTSDVTQTNPLNKILSYRSYGSSSSDSFAYANYGSEILNDEKAQPYPVLHFSCEYNPSTFCIRLSVQNLRNMNSLLVPFNNVIDQSALIFLRFTLSTTITSEPRDTSLQHYQDFIRFDDTFNILNKIRPGDVLDYQIKFFLMLITGKSMYKLGEAIYSMKDDQLTHILYVEQILPIRLEQKLTSATD